jgi:hypothetical protein
MSDLIGMREAAELLGGVSINAARELLRRRGVALVPIGGRFLVERGAVLGLLAELEREAEGLASGAIKRRGGIARAAGNLARGGRRGSGQTEPATGAGSSG